MFHWVYEHDLARGRRPGYRPNAGGVVPAEEVRCWIDEAKKFGVRSIVCLLDDQHLTQYTDLPGGLLGAYRDAGFEVAHVPVADHLDPPLSDAQLQAVDRAYRELAKPVLVHCSAGIDRTGAAIGFIVGLDEQ